MQTNWATKEAFRILMNTREDIYQSAIQDQSTDNLEGNLALALDHLMLDIEHLMFHEIDFVKLGFMIAESL